MTDKFRNSDRYIHNEPWRNPTEPGDATERTLTPFVQDADFTLYVGDALDVLQGLPDESVHCCVTSPPYLGLRDYGMDGQIGLEPTIGEYVDALVGIFREVRRVLRQDATLWLNLGDSYNAYNGGAGPGSKLSKIQTEPRPRLSTGFGLQQKELKPKDLMGIPWRVAFALQADGWYLRSDIVWAKPNPMPESVTDRPTKAHEYVFLLTRSPRYYFDQEGVRERYGDPGREWWNENRTAPGNPNRKDGGGVQSRPASGPDGRRKTGVLAGDGSIQHRDGERWPNLAGRNLRSVWEIATQPYPDAHFATFPEALPERCIKAGTSERGCCPVCGAPWEREVESERIDTNGAVVTGAFATDAGKSASAGPRPHKHTTTLGWTPTCDHFATDDHFMAHHWEPVPCTVLDPFMGSGTAALVARKLGRRSIGIELSPEYAALCARRLNQLSLFAEPA